MEKQPRGRQSAQAGRPNKEGLLLSRLTTRVPTWTTGTQKKAPLCQMGTQSTPQVSAGFCPVCCWQSHSGVGGSQAVESGVA